MATLLEQLRSMTTVVADSGDLNSIAKFKPTDSTTSPSLIATAATLPAYQQIVDDVLKTAREQARATPLPPPVPRVTLGPGGRS